jgi:hypothetical protein
MMRFTMVVTTLALGSAHSLQAQGMFVPNAPLTAPQQAALDAIRDTRDSVVAAAGLLAALQRDMERKTPAALEGQARAIVAQCEAAERQRVASRRNLAAQAFDDPTMAKGQQGMLASMDRLKDPLAKCRATYAPLGAAGKGEEMRGYGVHRSRPIVAGLSEFERNVVALSKELRLPVREVLRAGPGPLGAPAPVKAAPRAPA